MITLPSALLVASLLVQSGTYTEIDVPSALRLHSGVGAIRRDNQAGLLKTYSSDKKLVIDWTASGVVNSPPDWTLQWNPQAHTLGPYAVEKATQEVPTRYFPTASCVVDQGRIAVGGMNSNGKTIIELWSLQWPSTPPYIAEDTNGIVSVSLIQPSVSQVNRIYQDDVSGRKTVANLCAIRTANGTPTSMLVQFNDSMDLYLLDLSSNALTLLGSSNTSGGSVGLIPGLAEFSCTAIVFGNHTSAGYVYHLDRQGHIRDSPFSATAPPAIVLVDSDRNGAIDGLVIMSSSDYMTQGWGSSSSYVDSWLN